MNQENPSFGAYTDYGTLRGAIVGSADGLTLPPFNPTLHHYNEEVQAALKASGDKPLDIRDIAMAVALVQLLYRFEDKDWRPGQPELASWFNNFIHRESFEQTQPVDHNRVN